MRSFKSRHRKASVCNLAAVEPDKEVVPKIKVNEWVSEEVSDVIAAEDVNQPSDSQWEFRGITKKEVLLLCFRDFVRNVTPQIHETSGLLSLMWSLAYLTFATVLLYQTSMTVSDYLSYPVTVSISLQTGSGPVEFPAVTICNNNMLRKSAVGRVTYLRDLALLDQFVQAELGSSASGITHIEDCARRDMGMCAMPHFCIPKELTCNGRHECGDGWNFDELLYPHNGTWLSCKKKPARNDTTGFCIEHYIPCPGEVTCAAACDGIVECVVEPGFDETEQAGCEGSCVQRLAASEDFSDLSSVNFPEEYPNSAHCEYVITGNKDSVIEVEFVHFDVEYHPTCIWDYLTIRDGTTAFDSNMVLHGKEKLCGKLNETFYSNSTLVSTQSSIIIYFYSDSVIRKTGFHLRYRALGGHSDEDSLSRNRRNYPAFYDYLFTASIQGV